MYQENTTLVNNIIDGAVQYSRLTFTFPGSDTPLVLTNKNLREAGLSVNRSSTTSNTLDLGCVYAAEINLELTRYYVEDDGEVSEPFEDVAFIGSMLKAEIGSYVEVEGEEPEMQYMPLGTFIIDSMTKNADSISLAGLDRMVLMDFEATGITATTMKGLVEQCLTRCNISTSAIETDITTLPNYDYPVDLSLIEEGTTYRQLLSYACQIMGVNAYFSHSDKLCLSWYNNVSQNIKPYQRVSSEYDDTPTKVADITFTTTEGRRVDYIGSTNGLVFDISDNPLIIDNVEDVIDGIGDAIVGTEFYGFNANTVTMPHLVPGDVVKFYTDSSNYINIGITDWTYTINRNTQLSGKSVSSLESSRALQSPFTAAQASIIRKIETKNNTATTDRTRALLLLNEAINNGVNLHTTTYSGAVYYHDKEALADSKYIATVNSNGFAFTTTGWNSGQPVWENGLNFVDGQFLIDNIVASTVTADMIKAGIIKSQTEGEDLLQYNLNDGSITLGNDDLGQNGKHFRIGKVDNESQQIRFVRTSSGLPVDYISIGHNGIRATYSLSPVFAVTSGSVVSWKTLYAWDNGIVFSQAPATDKSLKNVQSGISTSIASGLHTTTVNFGLDVDGNPLFKNVPNVTITPYRTGSWSYEPGTDRINFYISEITTDHFTIVSDVTVAMRFQWLAVDYSTYTI